MELNKPVVDFGHRFLFLNRNKLRGFWP